MYMYKPSKQLVCSVVIVDQYGFVDVDPHSKNSLWMWMWIFFVVDIFCGCGCGYFLWMIFCCGCGCGYFLWMIFFVDVDVDVGGYLWMWICGFVDILLLCFSFLFLNITWQCPSCPTRLNQLAHCSGLYSIISMYT